ncbi:Gfo/Idh/MocA family protein [Paenibacillus arenilitoris]|uniref:Gfo/Idh/MocA family oxidoreductase n=1 Tax=Paenibacillus arenilitoris TaxID=2772299 RepID=A0A927CJN8_9BACL|nr:Gfo/Idh/MocA family oxidoreductase [Paenibacillus arenilitoris]MBD2867426.1 Gfo/Idh/MocA family oxidoreductase [Paenibacillus arenilitoris]
MPETIRIGIIGSGGIARAHASAYKKLSNLEIVAVADSIEGKAQAFIDQEQLHAAAAFDDHRKLLELELDGVSVCTPNFAHHETSVNALNAGKHVLVEKPMSVTLDQSIDMVAAAKRSGKMLTVGFQPRYDPNMSLIKEIVQSGQLGKVYFVETGGGRRRGMPGGTFISKELAGAGAMADIGCYSLDMALNALGYPKPLTVSAYTSNYFGTNPKYHREADCFEVEDFGVAMIRLEGDIVLNYKISWAMHMDTLGATMFLGTDAGLKVTPAGSGPWSGVWDGSVGSMSLFHDVAGQNTQTTVPVIQHGLNLFDEKVKDFAAAIRDNRPAPIDGAEILYNQAIIDGVLRSAATKREVTIELPE